VVAVDTAGTMISTVIGKAPLHFAGDPLDQRSLDVRVTSTRDTSGCASSSFTSESTILRLAGDGTAKQILETDLIAVPPRSINIEPIPPPISTPPKDPAPIPDAPPAT